MKVLYIIDSLTPYGAEKSIVQLTSCYKIVIPVFVVLNTIESDVNKLLKASEIETYELKLKKNENLAVKALIPIIRSEKPAVLHSILFHSDMVARKLKKKFPDIPLVGSLVNNSYSKRRYKNLSPISKLKLFSTQLRDFSTIKKVDYFISNSFAIVEPNVKALGISIDRIKVIHRGRKVNNSPIEKKDSIIRKEFPKEKIFLSVGRLNKQKGHLDLIEAFNKIKYTNPDIILLIAGDGNLREILLKRIMEYGLEKNVHLLGFRNDINELLKQSDFFIFPSYFEGLSGALIEATMAKIPCIVSNIEENKECFPESRGLFFEPGNIFDIQKKIEFAIDKDWQKDIEEIYNFAMENFSLSKSAEKYEDFYSEILNLDFKSLKKK